MTRPIRVLELRTVRGTGGGPEKTILLGTARTDARRFAVTVCYIRDARDTIFSIDEWARALGVDYAEVLERHSFDPSIWPRLRQLIRERAIDIVHAHDYKANLLAWLLAKREGVLALSTVHGWTGHSVRERWVYYPADKRVLARFPRLIAVSSDVKRELVQAGARPDHVVTVLNGIDPCAFHRDRTREGVIRMSLGIGEHAVVIGAVGRLEPQKRFDVLIDAFADLLKTMPEARLVIAGDGSLREDLAARVAARGIADRCHLLGHRTDVSDLHHAFDLFVQSSDYEGTPNAVLEAMALETPIVATSAGGTAEVARDGREALIVPAGDRGALLDAIRCALDDGQATRARTAAARRRVETDLSFDARMRAVEQVYVDLFEERQQTGAASALAART